MSRASYDIICLVSNDISYDRRMIRCCRALASDGKKVLLIGRKLESSKALGTFAFDTKRVTCVFNSGPLFYMELVMRLVGCLRKLEYQKLLMTDLDTALVSRFAKKGDRKFFLDLHEYFEETPEIENQAFKKNVWKRVGKWSVPKCDVVYTVNDSLAEIFEKKYGLDVGVIRNVPSKSIESKYQSEESKCQSKSKSQIEEGETGSPEEAKNVSELGIPLRTVYLGVLNPGRGLEVLIDSIKLSWKSTLTIIGDGPLRSYLEWAASDCDRITFVGALDPDKISEILDQSQLGWNLLEDRSKSYYYSLANKFFDYIHHGLPVITMDFPEYSKIVKKHGVGLLLSDLNRKSIVETLRSIIDQEHDFQSMVESCDSVRDIYNWEIESKKLIAIFQ